MPLTLEQYAKWLDGRADLLWPAAPQIERPKAKPHLKQLPRIRVVAFSVYGTLLSLSGGELYFVHPQKFIMETALEKTVQEFKMWQAMSRKPGKPSEYMSQMYQQMLDEVRLARSTGGERYPEVRTDDIWERIVKRLIKNGYQFDQAFYGPLEDFCSKIGYFFHASLQGTVAQPDAHQALRALEAKGVRLGLIADAQSFTGVQLLRALAAQHKLAGLDDLFDPELRALSFEVGSRKPSERLFRAFISALATMDIAPNHVLHVGSHLPNDVVLARRLGFHTALFAGDKTSVVASNEQLNDHTTRPDVLVTELSQLADVIG